MSMNWLKHLKGAIANLNPVEVRQQAERPVRLGLRAASELSYFQMESYFAPNSFSQNRWNQVHPVLSRIEAPEPPGPRRAYDVEIHSENAGSPEGSFLFNFSYPEQTVHEIIAARPELSLPLARSLAPFRKPVSDQIIHSVSKENALFSLATGLPDIIPLLSLTWAAGEFASDTAVLTANQVRMAFLLGAANDRIPGYREQKAEIASIVGGAFGWRSLSRELVSKIPWGGGLIPKAAIAYAGTWVVGNSLERFYRLGYGMTRAERQAAYDKALDRGKRFAQTFLKSRRIPKTA